MANHSTIKLKRNPLLSEMLTPEDVEQAFAAINAKRFQGRLVLTSPDNLTENWQAAKAWILEAPGTRPAKPTPFNLDENLGFCFWLHKGGYCIEIRHVLHNSWIRWVQDVFKHELAQYFRVKRFDTGDGQAPTDPDQYKASFYDFITRNFDKPLSAEDQGYIEERFLKDIPEGWT